MAAGLLSRHEATAAAYAAADYPRDVTAIDAAIDAATTAHELSIVRRVRASIAPLIACRACRAAIWAQARFANASHGRLHALPDDELHDLVRDEITAASARMKAARG